MDKYIVKYTQFGKTKQQTVEAKDEQDAFDQVLGWRDKETYTNAKVTMLFTESNNIWRYGGVFKQ